MNMGIEKELSEQIVNKAKSCGFENCGIISIQDIDGYYSKLEDRQKNVPQSQGFYHNLASSFRVKENYPWAKSLVICITWQGKYKYPNSLQGKWSKSFALTENAASECDGYYQKLNFENWMSENSIRFERGCFPLRHAAVEAGLGIFRKNNFFYTEKGSWYALDGYLIDRECEYKHITAVRPCSENCNLCQQNCPTGAFSASYTMNPFHCVSFITTFGQGMVPEGLAEKDINQWVCGCDACQDACPYNHKQDWNQGEEFPNMDQMEKQLAPNEILKASDEDLIRNVCIRTADHIAPKQIAIIRRCAERSIKNAFAETKQLHK